MSLRSREVGIASESVLLLGVFFLAVALRFGEEFWFYEHLVPKALLCVAVLQLSLYYGELYELRARRRMELFLRLGQCLAIAAVALTVIFFAIPALEVGRGIFGIFMALVAASVIAKSNTRP